MLVFVVKRVLLMVPVLFVCVTILFGLMRAFHASPLRHAPLLGLASVPVSKYSDWQPQSIQRNQERVFGIDDPWYTQYVRYLGSVARFDFGSTFTFRDRTVNAILREQGPITLELVLLALAWALALGVPLGVLAALRRGMIIDRVTTTITALTMGFPIFFMGTVLAWLLAVKLDLVPVFGWGDWRAKLLPSFVLSLLPMSYIARVLRFEMLEVLGRDHVLAARGRGLRRVRVIGVHALRPAVIPVISMAGPLLGQLVTGMFLVEWIFAIPGVGRYFIAAAEAGDYPLTLGLTVVLTEAIIVANMLSDVALAAIDPRARDQHSARMSGKK
jgi:oligopeptide transport system permease protein